MYESVILREQFHFRLRSQTVAVDTTERIKQPDLDSLCISVAWHITFRPRGVRNRFTSLFMLCSSSSFSQFPFNNTIALEWYAVELSLPPVLLFTKNLYIPLYLRLMYQLSQDKKAFNSHFPSYSTFFAFQAQFGKIGCISLSVFSNRLNSTPQPFPRVLHNTSLMHGTNSKRSSLHNEPQLVLNRPSPTGGLGYLASRFGIRAHTAHRTMACTPHFFEQALGLTPRPTVRPWVSGISPTHGHNSTRKTRSTTSTPAFPPIPSHSPDSAVEIAVPRERMFSAFH